MTEDEFLEIKKNVEKYKVNARAAQMRRDELLEDLKEKYGIGDLESAAAEVDNIEKEKAKVVASVERDESELEIKLDEYRRAISEV